jgi:peptidoglycan/xylan/chitin deacetylase (PgdA/CDA1 family)
LIGFIYLIYIQLIFLFNRESKRIYCTILYYHSIPNDGTNRFKKQMGILNKISTPIPLEYDGMLNQKKRYCIITFDDAFKTIVMNGVPEFKELGIPFTIFIPTGCVGQKPKWLANTGHKDQYETVLSIQELLGIPSEMVTFGSHTVSHCDLTKLDYGKAHTEIEESKRALESALNKQIRYFSFPHGAYNATLVESCRKVGYDQVFSIIQESPLAPLRNYVKGRTKVDPSDWTIEFVLKAMGGYGWKTIALSIKQKLKALIN